MKETTVRVKVRPRRMTRAERKRIKRAQKAREELLLCQQAIAFHKAYLAIEMEHEEIKYEELQARLDALQAVVATTEIAETVEAVEAPAAEAVAVEETVVEETVEETAEETVEVKEEAEPATAQ